MQDSFITQNYFRETYKLYRLFFPVSLSKVLQKSWNDSFSTLGPVLSQHATSSLTHVLWLVLQKIYFRSWRKKKQAKKRSQYQHLKSHASGLRECYHRHEERCKLSPQASFLLAINQRVTRFLLSTLKGCFCSMARWALWTREVMLLCISLFPLTWKLRCWFLSSLNCTIHKGFSKA